MTTTFFSPPCIAAAQIQPELRHKGYAVLGAATVAEWAQVPLAELLALLPSWNHLEPDAYLKDGGRYRKRRHACFMVQDDVVQGVPHRAHWQPLEYNALHGGMQRWFAPVQPDLLHAAVWQPLLVALGRVATDLKGAQPWFVEAHQFRIDTTDGIGRPTPEGAHRDGVDLVAVFFINRHAIKGGETRVFEAEGPNGQRFTLTEPWSLLLLDDSRVIHESTPIQPLDAGGYRDTLVVTLRGQSFQGEAR